MAARRAPRNINAPVSVCILENSPLYVKLFVTNLKTPLFLEVRTEIIYPDVARRHK